MEKLFPLFREREREIECGQDKHSDLRSSSVGIVEEDLEVLVEVSGVFCYLSLEELEQTVEGYLTEQVVGFLCKKKQTSNPHTENTGSPVPALVVTETSIGGSLLVATQRKVIIFANMFLTCH